MALRPRLCVLGLENKVQAILLIGALPLLILPFGSADSASVGVLAQYARRRWLATVVAAVAAIAAAWAAWPLIATGFDRALLDAAQFRPLLLGRFGIYQAALADPDRRLHDRLCRDLARQRRRNAGLDVRDDRRRVDRAARAQSSNTTPAM